MCISYVIGNSAFCVVGWFVATYNSSTVASIQAQFSLSFSSRESLINNTGPSLMLVTVEVT